MSSFLAHTIKRETVPKRTETDDVREHYVLRNSLWTLALQTEDERVQSWLNTALELWRDFPVAVLDTLVDQHLPTLEGKPRRGLVVLFDQLMMHGRKFPYPSAFDEKLKPLLRGWDMGVWAPCEQGLGGRLYVIFDGLPELNIGDSQLVAPFETRGYELQESLAEITDFPLQTGLLTLCLTQNVLDETLVIVTGRERCKLAA